MTVTTLLQQPPYVMPLSRRNYFYRWVGFYGSATEDI